MVDRPEEVEFDGHETDRVAVWDVYLADSDVGIVVGKNGTRAEAIRHVFGTLYSKAGKRLYLLFAPMSRRS